MQQIFIVMGYGVPKDIMNDGNYPVYLRNIFNHIYDAATRKKVEPIIIFSGGKTDLFKPCKRIEAGEIAKLFKALMQKEILKQITKRWRIINEINAYCTLDTLVFSQKIIQQKKLNGNITIFCEFTRANRIKKLANKIFKTPMKVIPIDFDVSDNRYRDPKFLQGKEKDSLKVDLWALKSAQNFKKLHDAYKERITYLRKGETSQEHIALINKWYVEKLDELRKLALYKTL